MTALLLAAGAGRRFSAKLNKCMIRIAGQTLYRRMIESLKLAGIAKTIVVTGHNATMLEPLLLEQSDGMELEFLRNDEYETTNNIWSFYLAVDSIKEDDLVVLESDLIYPTELIRDFTMRNFKNAAVVAKMEPWMDGTAVQINGDFISEFLSTEEQTLSNYERLYKTVNIYKFEKEFLNNICIPTMKDHIMRRGKNDYYELVFKSIVQSNLNVLHGYILHDPWYEIDTEADLDKAKNIFEVK